MPVSPYLSLARAADYCDELTALRAELRCILQHPAIVPARRQAAERLMCQCSDPGRLRHWLALAVAECGRWEELVLAAEGS
ncbi:hypothetical protein LGH70_22560 [Hymenobacter sp. BT635]|uniref:Uncharacterized protein n=1 Tax=Hymenobacter nitidus TaxID=2880929 RepID=A0ABS8AKA9_9BACT|nr:hypothetical protein [Hymenobacter nitidus]MCB2380392.1 hypothetical protein [Hymenobacter nitidus]